MIHTIHCCWAPPPTYDTSPKPSLHWTLHHGQASLALDRNEEKHCPRSVEWTANNFLPQQIPVQALSSVMLVGLVIRKVVVFSTHLSEQIPETSHNHGSGFNHPKWKETNIGDIPIFALNHDYGRKGMTNWMNLPQNISMKPAQPCGESWVFLNATTPNKYQQIWSYEGIILHETNIARENERLEYQFPFGMAYFQGLC